DGGEILHTAKACRLHLTQKKFHDPERVGAADAGQHGSIPYDRQHFAGHFHDDLVGVAIRHHPAQTAVPRHAEPARAINHDKVDPPPLLAFARTPRPCPATDDRSSRRHLPSKLAQNLIAGEKAHGNLSVVAQGVVRCGTFFGVTASVRYRPGSATVRTSPREIASCRCY